MIEFTFSSAGTYYVKVRDYSNLGGPGQSYNLRITHIDRPEATTTSALQGAAAKPIKKANVR